ncbi:hypothetical protein [Geomonas subterranea]|uniref:hypothetical protein n=1 Tax=Geomonas subterranea TaxID=2847989 RepID=UPI001CD68616|nr:hypothetical protein [Geomonas fuzhouensis]
MAANKNYRVVNYEILTSPCRKCSEAICDRDKCAMLIAFRARCDQELPSYGVCDFSDELPSPVKFNFPKEAEYEEEAPAAQAEEESESPVVEKPQRKKAQKQKPEPKAKPTPAPKPEPKAEPVAAEPLIPADMTLEQIFPPARMAQLAPQKLTQLSLF